MTKEQEQEIKVNAVKALESFLTFAEEHGDEILAKLINWAERYKTSQNEIK